MAHNTGPILCPFALVYDQQEGLPYTFDKIRADADRGYRPITVEVEKVHLVTADYAIRGMESLAAVERKSKEDFFGTLGQGRDRFVRELERMDAMQAAWVVVEAEWGEMKWNPPTHSQMRYKTIYRSVLAWEQRYKNVRWWFCPGRAFAETTTFRLLEKFWNLQQALNEKEASCK